MIIAIYYIIQLLVEISVGKANINICDRLNQILGLISLYERLPEYQSTQINFSQQETIYIAF